MDRADRPTKSSDPAETGLHARLGPDRCVQSFHVSDGPNSNSNQGTRPSSGSGDTPQPRRPPPNYAARRMLVGTAVIVLVFVAAVLAWRTLRDDGNGPDRDRVSWSQLAIVDRTTGDVAWVDDGGESDGDSLDHGRTRSATAADGVLSLIGLDTLTVIEDSGSDDDPLLVDVPSRGTVTPIRTSDRTFLAIGSPDGDVTIVDPIDGAVTDIAELVSDTLPTTPQMSLGTLRAAHDGSAFAIADAANFQTIGIRPDDTAPLFLPGRPIAIGDNLLATSQTVGPRAEVAFGRFDGGREPTVPSEIPAGGVIDDDRLLMVSIDGGIFRIEPGDEEAERIGTLAIPADEPIRQAQPAADGERIVVSGSTFQAIVDLDGETVFATVFPDQVEIADVDPSWACLPVGGAGHYESIVDVTTGEQLADLADVEVTAVVDEGCTVLVDRGGIAELVSADGVVTVGRVDDAIPAPDGRSVVIVDGATTSLVPIDEGELGDPIDLTALANPNSIIVFVPD